MKFAGVALAAMAAIGLSAPVDIEPGPAPKPARKSRAKPKRKLTGVEIAARDLEAHRKFTAKRLKKAAAPVVTRQQRRAHDRQTAKGTIYRDEKTGVEHYV